MLNIDHSTRSHSVWSASSAERWMACPASIRLSEGMPDQSSPYAAEGTCAHELAEKALLEDKQCIDYVGQEFHGWTVDEEMAGFVQVYVDYVRKAARGIFKDTLIEERFDLSNLHEGLFGTNDACVREYMGTLEVIDLKYGKGVPVFPEKNKQLMYYALGAMQGGEYNKIKLTIIQPRVDEPIKSWSTKPEYIEKFKEDLLYAVEKTKRPDAEAVTGDHCKFCKAKAICPAQKKEAAEITRIAFADDLVVEGEKLPAPSTMDDLHIAEVLTFSKQIRDWIDSVESYAVNKLSKGQPVIGFKLVAKRANRKLIDTALVEKTLLPKYGDKIFKKRELVGIPALEKLVDKEELKDLIFTPDAGYTLAPMGDKRPEVKPQAAIDLFNEKEEAADSSSTDNDFDNLTF